MKHVTIAIRDFAVPAPRVGSIEAHSGFGRSAIEGQEIHRRVQRKRAKSSPDYESEVLLSRTFNRENYCFHICGRADGLFRGPQPTIEEIKSAFNIADLRDRLCEGLMTHPYCLQLQTYGYFYWLENGVTPNLTFHLVSTRSRKTDDLRIVLDTSKYESWSRIRLDELVAETQKAEKQAARRKKTAKTLSFPFQTTRPGQTELIQEVENGLRDARQMLIQAPTGLGKTAGVLFPVLKEALARGQRVVYVTPKNSQHAVPEDALTRFTKAGSKIKSLTITAKTKICLKDEPLCNPDYCEYARDYYTKVYKHALIDRLTKKRKLTSRIFRKMGNDFKVCPFELQLDVTQDADVVICDYNYVFAPRAALGRLSLISTDQKGKPNLVIDEAHNLPSRGMDCYSGALSAATVAKFRGQLQTLPAKFRNEFDRLLSACIDAIRSCRRTDGPAKIDPPSDLFANQDAELHTLLSRYLESNTEIRAGDVVLRFCYYWSNFSEALQFISESNGGAFFITFYPQLGEGTIKVTCCDASSMLKTCFTDYEHVVGFSATLKPFEYYAALSGFDPSRLRISEFQSPFPTINRKLMIIPQISTKYASRERNYFKIADAIQRIASCKRGNYFVFFPSFDFLERVYTIFESPCGFSLVKQQREMRLFQIEAILDQLRQRRPTLLFGVQGGVFSEGVDYPDEMAIGAFVIGPPLPIFDLEHELMRVYYQEKYEAGFDYAYAIPAMARAIQAAGRVIRSETDRGLIVLMDDRFLRPSYSRSMPKDWFERSADELISCNILGDIVQFWSRSSQ